MKPSSNRSRSTSGRRAYRPESHLRAERLEGRLVLSANLGIEFRKGALVITGSEGADTAVVNQPSKTVITVSLNGMAPQAFKASAVRSIVFNGLGGDDSFTNNTAVPAKADGGKGADTLRGGSGADELRGGDGNDRIFGNLGNDALYGGSGDDHVKGGDGNDRVYGEAGADDLHGGRGRDRLFGGRDNDDLYGDEDSDELYGEDGDDHLDGRQGRDRIRGGGGLDREDDSDDSFEDGDDDGDGYDNDHDRPISPGLTTPIEFTPEGTAQLMGTSAGERDRKYYSFTATASQTLTVTILPDVNGRYAELEVKNGTTGRELLELEPSEDGITTAMMPVVAGTTYVIKISSSYDYTAVGYTVDLLLDDSPISPIVGTAIEFDANGFAQLTGTVAGEDAKKVYSFTATANGTLTATLLPGVDGRYAEVEAENRATGTDVLELRSRRTSGSFAVVAGQTYVFEIESPFERSGVDFTLNLQLS